VRREAPADVPEHALADGTPTCRPVLAEAFGVSRGEARAPAGGGGVKVDGAPLAPEPLDLPAAELDGRVLQLGKRRFVRLRTSA
jgi:tyrosyl-tRNA synthetase